jgi:hypothetical protein
MCERLRERRVAPIHLRIRRDALLLQQRADAKTDQDLRRIFSLPIQKRMKGTEIQVVILVVPAEDDVDLGKTFNGHTRIRDGADRKRSGTDRIE